MELSIVIGVMVVSLIVGAVLTRAWLNRPVSASAGTGGTTTVTTTATTRWWRKTPNLLTVYGAVLFFMFLLLIVGGSWIGMVGDLYQKFATIMALIGIFVVAYYWKTSRILAIFALIGFCILAFNSPEQISKGLADAQENGISEIIPSFNLGGGSNESQPASPNRPEIGDLVPISLQPNAESIAILVYQNSSLCFDAPLSIRVRSQNGEGVWGPELDNFAEETYAVKFVNRSSVAQTFTPYRKQGQDAC